MKKIFLTILILFSVNIFQVAAQSNPIILAPGIGIKRLMTVQDGVIRVALDPVTKKLYYVLTDGTIYEVIQPDSGAIHDSVVFATAQHGVQYVQGMTFHDSTLYLAGNNNSATPLTKGIVTRGKLQPNGSRLWDTLMITQDYQTADFFDHLFTGITLNATGDTVFVCSGARGDHGEIQTRYGIYPGLRNVPITTLIFALPAHASMITLQNDSASLASSGYVYCRGIRSTFDMAFDSNGNLFGVENSGDYDHSEEMNLLLRDHHYGYPWKMGDSFNPQQFPSFNPANDPLINHFSRAWRNGFWNNDPAFPPQPPGVTFETPIKNYGPDCDKYRDSTGMVQDASDNGIPLATFSAHRSPLGLVFDKAHVLGANYSGDGFMLSWTKGYDSCGCSIVPDSTAGTFLDPSQDLVHLDLTFDSLSGAFILYATRIISEFDNPVDADIDNNKIYVIENGYAGTSGIYEVTFMDTLPCNPVLLVDIPDPCNNNDSNSVSIPAFGVLPDYISWYDDSGVLLRSDTLHITADTIFNLPQGNYYAVFSDSGFCGTDTSLFLIPDSLVLIVDSVVHTSCMGCNDGVIYYSVFGGVPPYIVNVPGGLVSNDSITNLVTGVYSISVTDSNSCQATNQAAILDDPTIIVCSPGFPGLIIYPNPSNGIVSVRLKNEEKFSVKIIDTNGKVVKQFESEKLENRNNEFSIDCSGISKGCYSIEINSAEWRIFKKLVFIN